ncbi:hypothetical protein ACH5RR_020242 [Cinchona calisaya]|uniref:Uncharacterized protein n=1 Tax=Cinchona calisaya TaxID=153742 RepID=A0ABD2ZIV6_9GENT
MVIAGSVSLKYAYNIAVLDEVRKFVLLITLNLIALLLHSFWMNCRLASSFTSASLDCILRMGKVGVENRQEFGITATFWCQGSRGVCNLACTCDLLAQVSDSGSERLGKCIEGLKVLGKNTSST